jgi:hypothetical protein
VGLLFVISVFAGLTLVNIRAVRVRLGPLILRLWSWAAARFSPVTELDEEADYLSKVLRRQQLCSEIDRLQRILATDMSMSATRQIANRIAYAQLVHELRDVPDFFDPMASHAVTRSHTSNQLLRAGRLQPPTVEILEIGWRRRS